MKLKHGNRTELTSFTLSHGSPLRDAKVTLKLFSLTAIRVSWQSVPTSNKPCEKVFPKTPLSHLVFEASKNSSFCSHKKSPTLLQVFKHMKSCCKAHLSALAASQSGQTQFFQSCTRLLLLRLCQYFGTCYFTATASNG